MAAFVKAGLEKAQLDVDLVNLLELEKTYVLASWHFLGNAAIRRFWTR
jgi:hypothetical protein